MYEGTLAELCTYRILRTNLIVISFCWSSTSVGFYGLAYVIKYLNGNIFLNAYSISAGEVFGKLSTICLLRCMSLRQILLLAFSISSFGLLLIIIFAENEALMPWLLGLARVGVSQAFVALYLSIVLFYPTILASTAIGVCVTVGKAATTFAPMIAEAPAPANLIIVMILTVLAAIVSQFLDTQRGFADG